MTTNMPDKWNPAAARTAYALAQTQGHGWSGTYFNPGAQAHLPIAQFHPNGALDLSRTLEVQLAVEVQDHQPTPGVRPALECTTTLLRSLNLMVIPRPAIAGAVPGVSAEVVQNLAWLSWTISDKGTAELTLALPGSLLDREQPVPVLVASCRFDDDEVELSFDPWDPSSEMILDTLRYVEAIDVVSILVAIFAVTGRSPDRHLDQATQVYTVIHDLDPSQGEGTRVEVSFDLAAFVAAQGAIEIHKIHELLLTQAAELFLAKCRSLSPTP